MHDDVALNKVWIIVTALTLLDLSAAFDTINHTILMHRLPLWYSVSGVALNSYLSVKHQTVEIGGCLYEYVNVLEKYLELNYSYMFLVLLVRLLNRLYVYHLRQFRQSGDLESPPFVVRQVKVEFV